MIADKGDGCKFKDEVYNLRKISFISGIRENPGDK